MNRTALLNSTIGEYRVTEFLGAGGMGEVYRAIHGRIGQEVAIKVLTAESRDHQSGERFAWEARVQAGLHHPNIAAFHSLAEHEGRACIVMEYVDGQTLSDRIRFRGTLPANEALTIFQAVVAAVAYVHARGVIHRDLKSNNVKVAADGRVKLLDFGIACSVGAPKMTMTGLVVGSLESLSPEQLRGQRADEQSDIWALGVMLYEMLSGRAPFEGSSIGELCDRIGKGAYPPLSALVPATPREVQSLIARCLKKKPEDRFQRADTLLAETRRVMATLSAPKPPRRIISFWSPWSPWSPGPPGPRGSWREKLMPLRKYALALVVALAALIAFSTYYYSSGWGDSREGPARRVEIRTTEGAAGVWRAGDYLGDTPLKLHGSLGQRFVLTLKRDGYREKTFSINVGQGANQYDYTLEKMDHPPR